jgi:hypothetical protein
MRGCFSLDGDGKLPFGRLSVFMAFFLICGRLIQTLWFSFLQLASKGSYDSHALGIIGLEAARKKTGDLP